MSSVFVTHTAMKAFERYCNWFMTCDAKEPANTILSKYFASRCVIAYGCVVCVFVVVCVWLCVY